MPVVVTTSSAMPALPASLAGGTTAVEPIGFTGLGRTDRTVAGVPEIGQILHSWRVFGLPCLDSERSDAISPPIPARDFSRRLFLRRIQVGYPIWQRPTRIARKVPITTEQKAGPDDVRGRDRTRRN